MDRDEAHSAGRVVINCTFCVVPTAAVFACKCPSRDCGVFTCAFHKNLAWTAVPLIPVTTDNEETK